jgi:hypothetical protein
MATVQNFEVVCDDLNVVWNLSQWKLCTVIVSEYCNY